MYGLPKKICSDHRGENVPVWRYMITVHGHQQCVIVGSSTHNERIERLWRDVHRSVLVTFGNVFREVEDEGHLDSLNEIDMFCLQSIFLPRINDTLSTFTRSWNNHAISTEQMQTPLQLYFTGQLAKDNQTSTDSSFNSDFDSDSDSTIPSHDPVPVPRCSFKPCQQMRQIIGTINPLMQCSDQGKGLYIMEATNIVGQHLMAGCQYCSTDA